MSRHTYKQLKELVDTTNSNLSKANLDMVIKTRNYDGGYILFTNEGIETLCSGSLKECDKFLRGINKAISTFKYNKILRTDSYKVEHLPYRGK